MLTGPLRREKGVAGYNPVGGDAPPPPGASADRSSAWAFTDSINSRRSNALVSV